MAPASLEQLYQTFLQTGDEAALQQLMRRCAPTLRRQARRLGAAADDAEDLVQETIVAAIQGAERYDPRRPLLPWLKGILTFRAAKWARDEVRRRQRCNAPSELDPSGLPAPADDTDLAHRELDADVRAAIAALPDRYREPLRQYLLVERSPVEIAAHLGLERATVRVRLHRGLRRLRARLLPWTGSVAALLFARSARASASRPRAGGLAFGAVALATVTVILSIRGRLDPPAAPVVAADPIADLHDREAGAPESPPPLPSPNRTPIATSSTPASIAPASLGVRVLDAQGAALAHVGVTLAPAHGVDPVLGRRVAVTGADGMADFADLEAGVVTLGVDRGGSAEVTLTPGANTHTFAVTAATDLRGRVVDAGGRPVADASIWLSSDASGPWRGTDVTSTGRDGRFELRQVATGACVAARHPQLAGSAPHRWAGAPGELELRLGAPGGRVRVEVRDGRGRPVTGAHVFVGEARDAAPLELAQGAAPWRPPPFEGRTGDDGDFTSGALAGGRQPIHVRATGHAPQAAWVEVAHGTTPARIVLVAGGCVRGYVVDPAGQPIHGADVVFRSDDPSASIDTTTGADGAFAFACVPAGPGDVAVRARGFVARIVAATADAIAPKDLTVALNHARHIHGFLRAEAGVPVAGAQVRALWPPSALHPDREVATVGADGGFAFATEADGPPGLAVRMADEPLWRSVDADAAWSGDVVEVRLPPGFAASSWVHGTLHCADARALAGARLFVCRDGVQWAEIGRSDAEGSFRLGPLPPARYDLFAETTSPDLPSVPVGTFALADGEDRALEHTAPPTGAVDLEIVRTDGAPVGDLVVTLVGTEVERRYALRDDSHVRQVLLPGRYVLYAMGSRVQWLEAFAVEVRAGSTHRERIALLPAVRCTLAPLGLPRRPGTQRLHLRRDDASGWQASFTLAPDAPPRLAAVLAAGAYELTADAVDGTGWRGTFSVVDTLEPGPPLRIVMQRR
ncbi:MAG: sigma-70 family RNA polymerase sigma factor [Planctomycetota bacterium]